ncbi:8872_t:CDS:1, partial [Paraglomus occultum]
SKWLSQRNGDKSVTIDFQIEAQALWAKLNEYNVFGDKCSSESNLTKNFSDLFELLLQIRFSFYPLIPYTKRWYEKYALLDRVHSEVDRLIREELEHREESTITKADLLSLLLKDEELDEEIARAEIMTLLFATFDNFTGLSYILLKFAELKDVQTKIRNEVQSVWGNDSPTKLDDLTSLVYTRAAIKEALRHGGTGNFNFRVLTQDYRIQNKYFIPKGAHVVTPVRLLHKNPNHWENPDKFDPER